MWQTQTSLPLTPYVPTPYPLRLSLPHAPTGGRDCVLCPSVASIFAVKYLARDGCRLDELETPRDLLDHKLVPEDRDGFSLPPCGVCLLCAGAVGSFSNKPLSPKFSLNDTTRLYIITLIDRIHRRIHQSILLLNSRWGGPLDTHHMAALAALHPIHRHGGVLQLLDG